jgi:hypothetical protein
VSEIVECYLDESEKEILVLIEWAESGR